MSDKEPTVYLTTDIPEEGLEVLKGCAEVQVWTEKVPPTEEQLINELKKHEPEGLLCTVSDEINKRVINSSQNLSVISTFSVGYDHIDVEIAKQRGISIGYTPDVLSETTADHTWTLILGTARRLIEAHNYVKNGNWEAWGPTILTGKDIHDSVLGVIGIGSIGSAVARRAAGFDMEVLYYAREPKPETEQKLEKHGVNASSAALNEVLRKSDFITLHVPLNEGTRDMISFQQMSMMKENSILINTSRGGVVNTRALQRALEEESIAGAAIDVSDPEPLPKNHPLFEHVPEKLIVTPHIGSASRRTRGEMARIAAKNIVSGLEGRELVREVTPQP